MPDKPKKSWTFQVRFNDTEDPLKLFIRPSLNCMDQVGLFFNQYSLEIDDEGARVYIKSKFVRSLSEFWSQKLMFNVFQNIRSSSFISPQVFSTTLLLLQHHFSQSSLLPLGRPRAGWGHQISLHDSTTNFSKIQVLTMFSKTSLLYPHNFSLSSTFDSSGGWWGDGQARTLDQIFFHEQKKGGNSWPQQIKTTPSLSKSTLHSFAHNFKKDHKMSHFRIFCGGRSFWWGYRFHQSSLWDRPPMVWASHRARGKVEKQK